jgi:hypothetical protein
MSKKQEITKKEMLAYLKDVRGIAEVEETLTGLFLTVDSRVENNILYIDSDNLATIYLVFSNVNVKTGRVTFYLPEWNFHDFQTVRDELCKVATKERNGQ